MHLSMHNWIRTEPLEATARRLATYGYDSVELAVTGEPLDTSESRRILREAGIRCWAVVTASPERWSLISPDEQQRTAAMRYANDCVRIAHEMEARVVTLVPAADGPVAPATPPESQWRWAVDALREIQDGADKVGVQLAIEPLNRYETYFAFRADQALRLAEATSPRCGLALDVFHMNIEEADPLATIARVGKRIADFHVSDTNRLAAGMGHWDWAATVDALRRAGYDGALTLEFVPARSRVPVLGDGLEQAVLGRPAEVLSESAFCELMQRTAATLRPLIS